MAIQEKKLSDLFKEDEISYLDVWIIFKIAIKKKYKIILIIIFLMSLISVMQYKFTPSEYEASSTVLIEQNSKSDLINQE